MVKGGVVLSPDTKFADKIIEQAEKSEQDTLQEYKAKKMMEEEAKDKLPRQEPSLIAHNKLNIIQVKQKQELLDKNLHDIELWLHYFNGEKFDWKDAKRCDWSLTDFKEIYNKTQE